MHCRCRDEGAPKSLPSHTGQGLCGQQGLAAFVAIQPGHQRRTKQPDSAGQRHCANRRGDKADTAAGSAIVRTHQLAVVVDAIKAGGYISGRNANVVIDKNVIHGIVGKAARIEITILPIAHYLAKIVNAENRGGTTNGKGIVDGRQGCAIKHVAQAQCWIISYQPAAIVNAAYGNRGTKASDRDVGVRIVN